MMHKLCVCVYSMSKREVCTCRGNTLKRRLQVADWFQLTGFNPILEDIPNRTLCHIKLEKLLLPILWFVSGNYKKLCSTKTMYMFVPETTSYPPISRCPLYNRMP